MDNTEKYIRERHIRLSSGSSPASPLYLEWSAMTSQQRYSAAGYRMFDAGVKLVEEQHERLRVELSKKDARLREKTNEVKRLKTQNSRFEKRLESRESSVREELDKERQLTRDIRKSLSDLKEESDRQLKAVEKRAKAAISAAERRAQEAVEAAAISEDSAEMLRRLNDLSTELAAERASRMQVQADLNKTRNQKEVAERKALLRPPDVAAEEQKVVYRFKPREISDKPSTANPQGLWTLEELQSALMHLTANGAEDWTVLRVSASSIDSEVISDGLPPQAWERPVDKHTSEKIKTLKRNLDGAVSSARKTGFLVGLPLGIVGAALVGSIAF